MEPTFNKYREISRNLVKQLFQQQLLHGKLMPTLTWKEVQTFAVPCLSDPFSFFFKS